MMSDNQFQEYNLLDGHPSQPPEPASPIPGQQHRARDTGDIDGSGADLHEKLRARYAPGPVPEEVRDGAIGWRFGHDDPDAVHAKAIRAVQDTSAIRAEWIGEAVEHGLGTSDPSWKWALYPNGVDDDVRAARHQAEQAGVAETELAAAEQLGSEGVPWSQRPSHPHLGRIDLLSGEVHAAGIRSDNQQRLVYSIAERVDDILATLDEVRQSAARTEAKVAALAEDLTATGLLSRNRADTPAPGHSAETTPAPPNTTGMREHADDRGPDGGHKIGDAVDAAMPEGTAWPTDQTPNPATYDREPVAGKHEVER